MNNLNKLFLISMLLIFSNAIAQAPQRMSYQAIVRDNTGNLLANQLIGMKVSILQGSISGTVSYSETHSATTNISGLITIEIGGGNPFSGTFAGIDWSNGSYFIKTETDPTGGTNYTISGTSQLLSVPYALYAENTRQPGKSSIYLMGNITNAEAVAKFAKEFGPNTESIYIRNTTALTSIDLSAVTHLVNIEISSNAVLSSINLNSLIDLDDVMIISHNPGLTSLNFPAFVGPYGHVKIEANDNVTSIDIPNLSESNSYIYITNHPALTSLSIPLLTKADRFWVSGNTNLSSLSVAGLTTVNYFGLSDTALTSFSLPITRAEIEVTANPILTSISFPALTEVYRGIELNLNPNLSSIQIPQLANFFTDGGALITFNANNDKLPSSEVNNILSKMLTVTPNSGKRIYVKTQNPLAPPTGQGIIDKAALISAGNTVQTD